MCIIGAVSVALDTERFLWRQILSSSAVLAGLGLGGLFWKKLTSLLEHPVAVNLQTYLKLPEYGEHLGLIPVLRSDIAQLCELELGTHKNPTARLIVFVDDLDRCGLDGIVQTLEAIRLVMDLPNVFVIVAIDDRIALRAVAEHYASLGSSVRKPEDIARDYLGKIIQLPVRLQAPQASDIGTYIEGELFANVERPPGDAESEEQAGALRKDATPSSALDQESRSQMAESWAEVKEFRDIASDFEATNPRQLRRLRNSYRLLKGLCPPELVRLGWQRLMVMLFWQEALHTLPRDNHSRLHQMFTGGAAPPEKLKATPIPAAAYRRVHDAFGEMPAEYKALARFVCRLVLPRSG